MVQEGRRPDGDPLRRRQAPAGEMPVVLGRRRLRASSSTRPSATAWRPTSTARASRSTPTGSASRSRKPFVTIVDDGTQAARPRRDQRRRRGQRRSARRCSWRTASSPPTCTTRSPPSTTGSSRPATGGARATATRPMPRMRTTYMLPGPAREGRDHRVGEEGHLLHELHQRPGADRRGRLHLLREERLPHRGRQADHARSRTSTSSATARRSSRTIDMVADDLAIDEGGWTCGKDGQSVPGLAGHSHRARRVDHRRRPREQGVRWAPWHSRT